VSWSRFSPIHGGRSRPFRDLEALGVEGLRLASPAPFPVVHRVHRPGTERLLGWLALAGAVAGLATAVALQVYASLFIPSL